jgi:hypothetical protein
MVGVITHQLLQNNIKKNKYKYIMGCINKSAAITYDCTNVANSAKAGIRI